MKHTPGPWHTKPESDYVAAQVWATGICVAEVFGESKEARKANAQLMAAAPDLYQALVGMVAVLENVHAHHVDENWLGTEYRAAIAALEKAYL